MKFSNFGGSMFGIGMFMIFVSIMFLLTGDSIGTDDIGAFGTWFFRLGSCWEVCWQVLEMI